MTRTRTATPAVNDGSKVLHGHVTAIVRQADGDELALDAFGGSTTLSVIDVADFDEDGGSLRLNGKVYTYLAIDDDTSTITIADPGIDEDADAVAGDVVEVWDLDTDGPVVEYVATVVDETNDDVVQAVVTHSLADRLADSVRGGSVESVECTEDTDGIWVVTRVLGKSPEIDGDLVKVPNPADGGGPRVPLTSSLSTLGQYVQNAITQAAAALEASVGAQAYALRTYRQPYEPTPGGPTPEGVPVDNPIRANSVWVNTGDGYRFNVRDPSNSAWVQADTILTEVTVQTSRLPNVGIKLANNGLVAYGPDGGDPDGLGDVTVFLDASSGALYVVGPVISGAQMSASVFTGGVVQTTDTPSRGVKITSSGFIAYNGSGTPTFTVLSSDGQIATTGAILSLGQIIGTRLDGVNIHGSTYEGTSYQTPVESGSQGEFTAQGLQIRKNGTSVIFITADLAQLLVPVTVGSLTSQGSVSVTGGITATANIGTQGQVRGADVIATNETGVGNPVPAYLTNAGRLTRTGPGSSRKVKQDIDDMTLQTAEMLYELRSVMARYKAYPDGPLLPMFIAEEAAEVGAEPWVTRDDDGEPNGFRYLETTPAIVRLLQHHRDQITELREENVDLRAQLAEIRAHLGMADDLTT